MMFKHCFFFGWKFSRMMIINLNFVEKTRKTFRGKKFIERKTNEIIKFEKKTKMKRFYVWNKHWDTQTHQTQAIKNKLITYTKQRRKAKQNYYFSINKKKHWKNNDSTNDEFNQRKINIDFPRRRRIGIFGKFPSFPEKILMMKWIKLNNVLLWSEEYSNVFDSSHECLLSMSNDFVLLWWIIIIEENFRFFFWRLIKFLMLSSSSLFVYQIFFTWKQQRRKFLNWQFFFSLPFWIDCRIFYWIECSLVVFRKRKQKSFPFLGIINKKILFLVKQTQNGTRNRQNLCI